MSQRSEPIDAHGGCPENGFTLIFPITFISAAFVPVESMPEGLRQFAEVNPITVVVDAMRSLWLGAPAGNSVWGAIAWSVALRIRRPIAHFAPANSWACTAPSHVTTSDGRAN